jgi:hypothetical protein
VGADWNVQIAVPDDPLIAASSVPPNAVAVVRSQPVFELPGSFTLTPSVIAVDPERYATGGWWRSDYSKTPLDTWLADIEVPDPAVPVSGESFAATVTAGAPAEGLQLQVTYETGDDHVRTASAGTIVQGTKTYEARWTAPTPSCRSASSRWRPRPRLLRARAAGRRRGRTRRPSAPGRRCSGAGATAP